MPGTVTKGHIRLCLAAAYAVISLLSASCSRGGAIYNICNYGAISDSNSDNAAAINYAIRACAGNGGGTVYIPEGRYVTGTIHLLPAVRLQLAEGAEILGSEDLDAYRPYIPTKDMSRYDSGAGTANSNCISDTTWCKALILAVNADGASICGKGVIDGRHVFNPRGEENMRGPHTILIAESSGVTVKDISIRRAANYAVLAYEIKDSRFSDLHISEGWDGIHIRGAVDSGIEDCMIETGDDCIAGGYWEDFNISDCFLNSSCNGIRMIMPSKRLDIEDCMFKGPGKYPHRTSSSTGKPMLYGISLEPGGWGPAPGDMEDIEISDCSFESVLSPLSVTLQDDNHCRDIRIEDCSATDCYRMAMSVKSWGAATTESVLIRDCSFTFKGIDDPEIPERMKNLPFDQWPYFPSWGAWFRNVDRVVIEDSRFNLDGIDYRPDVLYDNVGSFIRK